MQPTTHHFKLRGMFISAILFFATPFVSVLTALGLYGLVQLGATRNPKNSTNYL